MKDRNNKKCLTDFIECLAINRKSIRKIIPEENKKNLEDIPTNIKNKLEFIFVEHMNEVINHILGVKI